MIIIEQLKKVKYVRFIDGGPISAVITVLIISFLLIFFSLCFYSQGGPEGPF